MNMYCLRIVALSLAIALGCAVTPISERVSETAQRGLEIAPEVTTGILS